MPQHYAPCRSVVSQILTSSMKILCLPLSSIRFASSDLYEGIRHFYRPSIGKIGKKRPIGKRAGV